MKETSTLYIYIYIYIYEFAYKAHNIRFSLFIIAQTTCLEIEIVRESLSWLLKYAKYLDLPLTIFAQVNQRTSTIGTKKS